MRVDAHPESVTQWVTDWKWSRRKALVPRTVTRCVMDHGLGHEVGIGGTHGSGHAWCFSPGVDFSRDVLNHIVIDTTPKEATLRGWGREIGPVRWTDVHG